MALFTPRPVLCTIRQLKMIFIPRTCYIDVTLVFRSILYQVDINEVNILIAG